MNDYTPKRGDRFTKNGKTVVVHEVKRTEVLFHIKHPHEDAGLWRMNINTFVDAIKREIPEPAKLIEATA